VSICRYFHRSLNPKKLIDVGIRFLLIQGFSHLPRNSTMARQIKLYKVPETPANPTLRLMQPGDAKAITKSLNAYLAGYDFAPVFTLAEVKHWFTPIDGVVYSYVTEVDGKIDAFVSFYCLPSTIINHPLHSELNAMYLFYYVPPKDGSGLKDLVNDALIMAKQVLSNYLTRIGGRRRVQLSKLA
jgi:glycylpeptide N-tetradecanoyltransferase